MDAKRLVPVLHVQAGRIVDPGDGGDLGPPATWARRLEMEGADELLLVELDRGGPPRRAWLREVARTLAIPFTLEAAFGGPAELAAALADGADAVAVPARDLRALGVEAFGRSRITAVVEVTRSPGDGWAPAMELLRDLGQAGAGSILLSAGSKNLAELCAQTARLATPVLLACEDPGPAAEALGNGGDGIYFPAGLRTANEYKDLLAGAGVLLRR